MVGGSLVSGVTVYQAYILPKERHHSVYSSHTRPSLIHSDPCVIALARMPREGSTLLIIDVQNILWGFEKFSRRVARREIKSQGSAPAAHFPVNVVQYGRELFYIHEKPLTKESGR